jgi:signal transduction histidine kinase
MLTGRFDTPVTTRPQALRRIVGNLVDNALKFGGAADIIVETLHDGQATITVVDRGPGIPADQLEAVFQPFYRLEASRNRHTGGTGLGLAIARQLALAMDATLTLRNRDDGGGLEATLTLPLRAD